MLFNLRSFLVRNSPVAFFMNRYICFPWSELVLFCVLYSFFLPVMASFSMPWRMAFLPREVSVILQLFISPRVWGEVTFGTMLCHYLGAHFLSSFNSVGVRPPDYVLSKCLANYVIFMKCDCSLTRKLILFQNMIWLWIFYLAIDFSD